MAATVSFSTFPFPQTDHVGSTRGASSSLHCARPRMLKDFLQENVGPSPAKRASSKALEIHAVVVAAVKKISFRSVKARSFLPRSLSRRLSGKSEKDERESGVDFVVKVKDIIRWRSFRDLVDNTAAPPPLDLADSTDRYTAAATTTTTTTTTTSSNSSSWCESDFTEEDLPSPSWRGCFDAGGDGEGEVGKKYFLCVGKDSTEATAHAEDDKKVEVFSRREDEEEEQKLLEERARRLLEHVEAAISFSESCRVVERRLDRLLLEFLRRELTDSRESEADEKRARNGKKIRTAEGEEEEDEWYMLQKGKEAYVREMEREGKWRVLGDEENVELGLEIGGGILGCLVDEILLDIIQL